MPDTTWRLAHALFRAAAEHGELDAVQSDLDALVPVTAEPAIRRFLSHPLVPLAGKLQVLATIVQSDVVRRLLGSLVSARETGLLPGILRSFTLMHRRAAGRLDAIVEVPRPLTPEEETALRAAVDRYTGMRTTLAVRVNPELIGGVRVQIDGRVLDNSLQTRLAGLRERLLAA